MTSNRPKKASIWKQVAPWLAILALVVVALIIIFYLMPWLPRLWETISSLSPDDWSTIGEILRNTSGWVALLAAAGTITAMMITNRSRAQEAASSDFRQHIQWAVEKLSSEDQIEVSFAQAVIQHFAKKKPKYLSHEEHSLVQEIQETLLKLQTIEDMPEPEPSSPDESEEESPSEG